MRAPFLALVLVYITSSFYAKAQIIPSLGCNDKTIRLKAEQIKQDFKAQGMEVYKDAMIDMESRQPSPIAVQLNKGVLYQMVFIGSKEAKKINFEIYNGDDKKIDERILKHPALTNFMVYSFVPEKSDLYLIVLSQNKGTQNVCGSFTIMQSGSIKTKPNNNNPVSKPVTNPRYVPSGGKK